MKTTRAKAEAYADKIREFIKRKVAEFGDDWRESPDAMDAFKELAAANASLAEAGDEVEMHSPR